MRAAADRGWAIDLAPAQWTIRLRAANENADDLPPDLVAAIESQSAEIWLALRRQIGARILAVHERATKIMGGRQLGLTAIARTLSDRVESTTDRYVRGDTALLDVYSAIAAWEARVLQEAASAARRMRAEGQT